MKTILMRGAFVVIGLLFLSWIVLWLWDMAQ